MRNRYPIFISSPVRNVVEAAPIQQEPPQMQPGPNIADEAAPIHSPMQPVPRIVVEAAPIQQEPTQMQPVPNTVDEAAPNQPQIQLGPNIVDEAPADQQEPPQMVEQEPIIFDFDVAQEVEVPFEIDPAAQMMADLQMAQDIEMAELLAFEMDYDSPPVVEKEPKPQRNKRSTELFRNVDFSCIRCGKNVRRTDLPAETAIGFICSENCMTDE